MLSGIDTRIPAWVRLAPRYAYALLLTACAYDADALCGAGQTFDGTLKRCVCDSGFAFTGTVCVQCAKHEVPGASACECAPGYIRPAADAKCEKAPPAPPGGCTVDADCKTGEACDVPAAACVAPPPGFGVACTANDGCTASPNLYCDTFVTQTCQQNKCTYTPDNCFIGFVCCDLSAFGVADPTCVPKGSCQ
jgi:hypothetical protein